MKRTTNHRRTIGRLGLIVVVTIAITGLAAPSAQATGWRYALTVAGGPAAGEDATFAVQVENRSFIGILDRLDLPVPTAYAVTGATTNRGKISRIGNLIKLRKLRLFPGRTITVTVTTSVPCASSGSSTWSATGVKGLLGIPFSLDASASSTDTTISAHCYLEFLSQPQASAPGETIPGDEGPVSVGAFGGGGSALTDPSVDIAMDIGANPSGGTLAGTLSQPTTAGVASFGDLTIDLPGEGYTLAASATSFIGATSDPFTVAGVVTECAADEDCEASLGDGGNTSAFISAPANGSSAMIVASFTQAESQGIDCDGYEESSASTLVFDVQNTGEGDDRPKTVQFSIDTDQGYPDPEAFQVCYESETPFYARGEEDQVTLGLLLDCAEYPDDSYSDPVYNDPPCILERDVEGSTVLLTAQLPGGDPKGRV